ncbi:MAG: hypothetical protein ACU0GG_18120 [Paracoccaceae bacterium]
MSVIDRTKPSAPECQLSKSGSPETYRVLLAATQSLSSSELTALEEDLNCYADTGLIGVVMSRLLVALNADGSAAAA